MNKKSLLLIGPGFLFVGLALLLHRAAFLLARPVWVGGFIVFLTLSLFITYLCYRELTSWIENERRSKENLEKQLAHFRGILDDAHQLHNGKKTAFIEQIASLESEQEQMRISYEKLQTEMQKHKSNALSYQTSLQEALDELRCVRQELYLQKEQEKKLPKDLPQQYNQLRSQFDEKALILSQTRRRLFQLEAQMHIHKMQEEAMQAEIPTEEILLTQSIDELLYENRQLSDEIRLLEELLQRQFHKPSKEKQSRKVEEKTLELQFHS